MLKAVFRPDEEEIGTYLSRITRLVMALKTLGHELASTEVDKLILKAEISPRRCTKKPAPGMKKQWSGLEDSVHGSCFRWLIIGRWEKCASWSYRWAHLIAGGKESRRDDKLFSTPSSDPPPAVGSPTRRPVSLRDAGREGLARASAGGVRSDSPLRSKVAALEMELEALKRGSEASSPEKDLAGCS